MKQRCLYLPFLGTILISLVQYGCASTNNFTPVKSRASGAKQLFKQAKENLADGLFQEAIQGFSDVRTQYPYSDYARLALLGIADTNLEQAQYPTAIDSYLNFLRYYPSHEKASYARLQIGNSYFEQIPENWWFLPPSAEKDQKNIRQAISAYQNLIEHAPAAPESNVARRKITQCRRKLADHEIYVGQFYFSRSRYKATTLRVAYLLKHYSGLGIDAQALLLGAKAYLKLNEIDKARKYLNRIIENYSDSHQAPSAQQWLETIPHLKR